MADIKTIQTRLNDLMDSSRTALVVDGMTGPKTNGMIADFQKNVVKLRTQDGRVDPGGKTLAALNEPTSQLAWARLPASRPITPVGIILDVPMVTQARNMSCWYASCCMMAYYFRPGPREGLTDVWAANTGLKWTDIGKLITKEGLGAVSKPAGDFTEQQLEALLRRHGPICCYGRWDGVMHAVVLTGVKGGVLYFNDPNPAKKKRQQDIAWFNSKLVKNHPHSMLYSKHG